MKWFKRKDRTWKITKKGCKGINFRDTLLQGVNLIFLHNLVFNKGRKFSNYFDPETAGDYKKWLDNEIDELMKLLDSTLKEVG